MQVLHLATIVSLHALYSFNDKLHSRDDADYINTHPKHEHVPTVLIAGSDPGQQYVQQCSPVCADKAIFPQH